MNKDDVEELAKELYEICEYPNPETWEETEKWNQGVWRRRASIIGEKYTRSNGLRALDRQSVYLTLHETYPEGSDVIRAKYTKALCDKFGTPAKSVPSVQELAQVLLEPSKSKEINVNFGVVNTHKAIYLASAIHALITKEAK